MHTDQQRFSGPWAADFAETFTRAKTAFEKAALEDGKITDQEFEQTKQRFVGCLRNAGITFGEFGPAGGFTFSVPKAGDSDRANAQADTCSASSGLDTVGSLYFAIRRNPDQLDEAQIRAACLVRVGAVPPGYTREQFVRDQRRATKPVMNERERKGAEACSTDPLGILSTGTPAAPAAR